MEATNELYGFVILHYLAYDMTCTCVDRVLSLFPHGQLKIVIVDNASPNGSGAALQQRYAGEPCVHVLLNGCNEGFARGNNAGYVWLRDNCSPAFIIVMNNDVLVQQASFLQTISALYERTHFAVLGPDIRNPVTGVRQNPRYASDATYLRGQREEDVRQMNLWNRHILKCFPYYYLRHALFGWVRRFFPKKGHGTSVSVDEELEGVVLHGACYVFSACFMKKRPLAFNPATFLYFEEDILHLECMRAGLKMLYSPALQVQHLEDVSTDMMHSSAYRKEKRKTEEVVKSSDEFLRLCREG